MDYWNWMEKYKPILNHFDSTAAIDGCLFLPFGEQWRFVHRFGSDKIWSLIVTDLDDTDETLWEISSGIHYVNVQGYLATNIPFVDDLYITY